MHCETKPYKSRTCGFGRWFRSHSAGAVMVLNTCGNYAEHVVVDLLFYIPSIAAGAIPRTVQMALAIRSVGSARPEI